MSIINDALKKTQSAFSKRNNIAPTSDEVIITHHRSHPHVKNKRWLYISMAMLFILLSILTWHSFLLSLFHARPIIVKQAVLPAKKPVIILTGTMQSAQSRAALINHQLYHVGDMIEGYQIKQINYNDVVLLNPHTHNTRLITLTLHS